MYTPSPYFVVLVYVLKKVYVRHSNYSETIGCGFKLVVVIVVVSSAYSIKSR